MNKNTSVYVCPNGHHHVVSDFVDFVEGLDLDDVDDDIIDLIYKNGQSTILNVNSLDETIFGVLSHRAKCQVSHCTEHVHLKLAFEVIVSTKDGMNIEYVSELVELYPTCVHKPVHVKSQTYLELEKEYNF